MFGASPARHPTLENAMSPSRHLEDMSDNFTEWIKSSLVTFIVDIDDRKER
jgi:hypothetical protein